MLLHTVETLDPSDPRIYPLVLGLKDDAQVRAREQGTRDGTYQLNIMAKVLVSLPREHAARTVLIFAHLAYNVQWFIRTTLSVFVRQKKGHMSKIPSINARIPASPTSVYSR